MAPKGKPLISTGVPLEKKLVGLGLWKCATILYVVGNVRHSQE